MKNNNQQQNDPRIVLPPIIADKVSAMLDAKLNINVRKNHRISLDLIKTHLEKAIKEFDSKVS